MTKFKKGYIPWNKNKKLPYNPHYKKRGQKPWNKGISSKIECTCIKCGIKFYSYKKRKYCNHSCARKGVKFTKIWKDRISNKLKGNKNGRFGKGKIISEDARIRTSNTLKKRYKEHPELKENLRRKRYEQKIIYESKPEKLFQEELIKRNIAFKKHKYIKIQHAYQCDIFIEPNIVIEIDGDYWHNKSENIIKDKIRNKELIENGYKIFRIKTSYFLNKKYEVNQININKFISKIKNG